MRIEPTIIIDTREQAPLRFQHYQSERASMSTGDYTAAGLESYLCIERKATSDLISSLSQGRERFFRELQRIAAFPFRRLLLECTRQQIIDHDYRSQMTPASILGSLAAIEFRFGLPIVWAGSRTEAAALVEQWCYYGLREQIQQAERILKITQPTAAPTPAAEVAQ